MMARPAPADLPLCVVLYRYVWPFWLLKDATRGDRFARAAAYRHNRNMRIHLPGYLGRWLVVSAGMLAIASGFGTLSQASAGALNVFTLLAAGSGIAFACCVCVLFVTSYIYLYLGRHER